MPTKEQTERLISSWQKLLEGLDDKASYKLYKFARIYENVIRFNDKQYFKLLIPICYKIFSQVEDLNVSRGQDNALLITSFQTHDLYDQQEKMIVDATKSFVDAVSSMILLEMENKQIKSISHIKVANGEAGELAINLIY